MIEISIASESDEHNWESFVGNIPDKHHSYSFKWRHIIEQTFHHEPFYLIARRKDDVEKISGVLPLFSIHSLIFGKSLVSVPYLNAGGILAEDLESFRALLTYAEMVATDKGVKYLELRHRAPDPRFPANLSLRSHKVAMQLPLVADPEQLFNSLPAKLRSQVRRPAKEGASARVVSGSEASSADIDAFYSVFAQNMRDLGTPVYPKRLFSESAAAFGKQLKMIIVSVQGAPAAAGITIGLGNSIEIPWASSLRRFNKASPNMLLYWEAIKNACVDGYAEFDFGRSTPDSGPYKFKAQWGAKPLQLNWYYSLDEGNVPDINPKSGKFSTLVSCWQRLPLPIANFVGPWLTRGIP